MLLAGACLRAPAAEIKCASADSMAALMDAWTRGFTVHHAGTPARVTRRARFSADAFDALLSGEVQVAPFSRELFPSERTRYAEKFGGDPLLVPIATGSRDTKGGTHAIAIFVNEKNPVARVSLAQLHEVYARDGRVTTWGQLGAVGEWAAKEIVLHGMRVRRDTGNPPGIVNFLERQLLAGRAWRDSIHEHADMSGGPQALELIVRAVAADEAALGYSGFAYAQPGTKTLALGATDAGPFFLGTTEEIARRDYPLSRTIYLCVDRAPDAATREFIRYVLGPEGQQAIANDAEKFLPLPDAVGWPEHASYLTRGGAIAIVGYNDMQEMLAALCASFSAAHFGFEFALDLKGTRTAPPALASGKSALAPVGAEFSARELAAYRAATGGEPLMIRVAHASLNPRALSGPLAIFVHRSSPLASLTMAEVADIFAGADQSRALKPCGLGPETALGLFFQQRVLGPRALAVDFAPFPQSADVIKRVGDDPHAIGFAAAMRTTPEVKMLALAERAGDPPVVLTAENLTASRYPLDRHLLICARQPLEPWVRECLRFVLSRDGQEIVARGTLGYLPLNAHEIADERAKLNGAKPSVE